MKKKIVMLTLSLIVATSTSTITGCGKSDGEKARDEIMSNMDTDERASIAADQQAIDDYEAEKQAQADAIANETPINYAEVLEEKSLGNITFRDNQQSIVDINVLMPADEYIYAGDDHKTQNGQYFYGQNRANIGMYFFVANGSVADGMTEVGQFGNYTVHSFTDGFGGAIFVGDGSGMVIKIECKITTNEDDLPMVQEIFEKNLNYIVEQFENM